MELHFGGGPGVHSCEAVVSHPCVPSMIWEPTCLIGTRWVCYGRRPVPAVHSLSVLPREGEGAWAKGTGR